MKTKILVLLCASLFLVNACAYSFDVISSTDDSVVFSFICKSSNDCRTPGEEFCGDNQVYTQKCANNVCEIGCYPIKVQQSKETWATGNIDITPVNKKAGQPIQVKISDSRDGKPLVWGVDVYFGGGFKNEQSVGATHLAGTMAVATSFMTTDYVNGELFVSGNTDRQGRFSFTPTKPGLYVIFTLGKYIRFVVADASGNAFTCENDECETSLGEDADSCPQDCTAGGTATMPPPQPYCGDGSCDAAETSASCPQDCQQAACLAQGQSGSGQCCQGLTRLGAYEISQSGECVLLKMQGQCSNCGNGACDIGEDRCNCLQDCAANQGQQGQSGGDSGMLLIIIIVICAVVGILAVLFFLKSSKASGAPKPVSPQQPAPASQQAKAAQSVQSPVKCPKCGAINPEGSMFCINCGYKLK